MSNRLRRILGALRDAISGWRLRREKDGDIAIQFGDRSRAQVNKQAAVSIVCAGDEAERFKSRFERSPIELGLSGPDDDEGSSMGFG